VTTILNILDKYYELSTSTYVNLEQITSKYHLVKLSAFKFQPCQGGVGRGRGDWVPVVLLLQAKENLYVG